MKVIFTGPTLTELVREGRIAGYESVVCLPPAQQGDIARAVAQGANVIGLVDGRYEDVAAPWHKEIMYSLSLGVVVFGGGSLGALRAAECAAYGMIGVGEVFERYRNGELVDDSDVAQLHAPEGFGSFPLTEALVNVEATIQAALAQRDVSEREAAGLLKWARQMFFKDLTFEALASNFCVDPTLAQSLLDRLVRNRRDVKKSDALELLQRIYDQPDVRIQSAGGWELSNSVYWGDFQRLSGNEFSNVPLVT